MSLTRLARLPNSSRLVGRSSEQLDQRRARRREALGHLRRHRRVVLGRLPFEGTDLGADPTGGDHEDRQQHERQHRDLPRQAEHHRQREDERDDVRDDTGQRRGERPLGADHVVVQPADERAGVGAGEERDRHALHVLEHSPAQVEDEALAEPGRLEPLEQPDAGVDERDRADQHGQPDHGAGGPVFDDGVDGPAGEHGGGDAEHRRHRGEDEERDDRAQVWPGERRDPSQRVTAHGSTVLAVLLHRALERHPHADVGHVMVPLVVRAVRPASLVNVLVKVDLKSRCCGRSVRHMDGGRWTPS